MSRRVITLRDGKIQHGVAVRSELESELLDFKSSALGRAILRDEGLPEELREIAPRLRALLETVCSGPRQRVDQANLPSSQPAS